MSSEPGKWMDKLVGACFAILMSVIALYCTVRLIESIQGTLIVIMGVMALLAALVGVVVVIKTWRNRW